MSRSRHQTLKSVFGRKTASEINAMIEGGDEGVDVLVEKKRFKLEEQNRRLAARGQPKTS